MALPLLLGLGAIGAVKGFLGQRASNKQAQSNAAASTQGEQNNYARDELAYQNQVERRREAINFAKAYAASKGYDIPNAAFDALAGAGNREFPAFASATAKPYTPNPIMSGLLSGGTNALSFLAQKELTSGQGEQGLLPQSTLGVPAGSAPPPNPAAGQYGGYGYPY